MRSLIGLLWALGGAVAGFIAGAIIAIIINKVTDASNREGAADYFTVALGLVGAIVGIIAGLVLYGRSAPVGERAAASGAGTLALCGLIAAIALSIFAFMKLRETPLMYGNAQANLDMELRIRTSDIPDDAARTRWLSVEVQTAKTRPEGTPYWSDKRVEGEYTIVPVVQSSLYRSASRVIVVTLEGRQVEAFVPPMKRTPDPKAPWSAWYRPARVDPPYGVTPATPPESIVELRYKISVWGQ